MSETRSSVSGLSTARIETLVDGIFAVVMTLLVLDIKVPQLAHTEDSLHEALFKVLPNLGSYGLSFLVVGVYWVGQHNQFHFIKRSNRVLIWINITFLMSVSMIPFSAALLAEYWQRPSAIVVYGLNLIVTSLLLLTNWLYVTTDHRLVEHSMPPEIIKQAARRILIAPAIYVVAILAGLVLSRTELSLILYLVAPFFYILPGTLDRHWRHRTHKEENEGQEDSDSSTEIKPAAKSSSIDTKAAEDTSLNANESKDK
jgi:uncharacterized membrane protein